MKFLRSVCGVALLGFGGGAQGTCAETPVASFLRSDAIRSVTVSPDGEKLAYLLVDEAGDGTLAIYDYRTGQTSGVGSKRDDVYSYRWLSDELLFFSNAGTNAHYSFYTLGKGRPKAVMAEDARFQVLQFRPDDPSLAYCYYFPKSNADGVRSGLALVDVTKSNVRVSGREIKQRNVKYWVELPPGRFLAAKFDHKGMLRLVWMGDEAGGMQLYHHWNDESVWAPVSLPWERAVVLSFDGSGNSIWLAAGDASLPTGGLFAYDLTTGTLSEMLYSDPDYNLDGAEVIFDDETEELLGLTYRRAGVETIPLSPSFAKMIDAVKAAMPGWLIAVEALDDAEKRIVLSASIDRFPTTYLVYDLKTQSIQGLPPTRPWVEGPPISQASLVRWSARDGLPLQGLLTLPVERKPETAWPLVVLPHDGPRARSLVAYDPEVQLFVSRGYAVFQPNYRGSTGFSWAVSDADKDAYRKMSEDIAEGVKYLTKTGVIDPKRVAIMGSYFGGFLAVAAVAWEPELYACAVTQAGVFDWEKLAKDYAREDRLDSRDVLTRAFGDVEADPEPYRAMSPIRDLARVRAPVFVAPSLSGFLAANDQTPELVEALKKTTDLIESRRSKRSALAWDRGRTPGVTTKRF